MPVPGAAPDLDPGFSPAPPRAPTIPLVTAILPVRNRAASIARAIDSVLAQGWPDFELIVVDDGSTDATRAIVAQYGDRLTLLSQPGRGAYAARNLALRHARGELVAFIDSDDAWLPDRLARQIPLMQPGTALVYGDVEIVAEPRDDAQPASATAFDAVPPRRGAVAGAFAWGNFVPTCTVLVRRSALAEIDDFVEEPRISADYLAWFRIAQRHHLDFVDAPVARYTRHADGVSFDLGRSLAARIALFGAERAHSDDPAARATLDRLLVNLGLHLLLAVVRGRARSVERPVGLAQSAIRTVSPPRAALAIVAFIAHQLRRRTGRFFRGGRRISRGQHPQPPCA